MELIKILESFDLKTKEARLYLTALELGTASAKEIASKAGIQRTNFYDIGEKLLKMGLLKQIKKGRKQLFQAMDPEELVALEEKKIRELKEALPRLQAIANTRSEKPSVWYYEGVDGVKKIYKNMLDHEGEIVLFTTPKFVSRDQLNFVHEHIPERIARGNFLRMIGEISPENVLLQKKDATELRETRLLPQDIYNSNVEIGSYGNNVYVIDYQNIFGMVITSKDVAHTLKMIFQIVWNSGKIVDTKLK